MTKVGKVQVRQIHHLPEIVNVRGCEPQLQYRLRVLSLEFEMNLLDLLLLPLAPRFRFGLSLLVSQPLNWPIEGESICVDQTLDETDVEILMFTQLVARSKSIIGCKRSSALLGSMIRAGMLQTWIPSDLV